MAIRSPKWLVLAALVVATPDTPGVYELWDDDELMYVGATRGERPSLRRELVEQLLEHETRATHFSWEISYHPLARERELLAELNTLGDGCEARPQEMQRGGGDQGERRAREPGARPAKRLAEGAAQRERASKA
jgi:hypothetical protein